MGSAQKLSGYREALKTLQNAMEAARTLAEKTAGLEQRLSELQSEYASLLDTDDSVDSLKKESALSSTIRVLEAKRSMALKPSLVRCSSLL